MSKILVHLHIYYLDQVDYFIEKLKNISGADWDLWVTFSKIDEETRNKLTSFKSEVNFLEVENYGYDVWPFIKLVKAIDLDKYDYVIKLHTKRSMGKCKPNIIMFEGLQWRNALVDGILYNKDHFNKVISLLDKNKDIGMISNLSVNVTRDYFSELVEKELKRLGWKNKDRFVCMGTMFIVRSEVLNILKDERINSGLFIKDNPMSGTFFQTAHLYERMFSHMAINSGYKSKRISLTKSEFLKIKISKAIEPIGKFFFSCGREGIYRQKTIRILKMKVYQEKIDLNYTSENSRK